MTERNLAVTLADEQHLDAAKALFSSLYWQAGWRGDYMLLAHETPDHLLDWFRGKGILVEETQNLFTDSELKSIHARRPEPEHKVRFLKATLKKYHLFKPEYRRWRSIVYLDCDVLVRADLTELTELAGFSAVRAVQPRIKHYLVEGLPLETREIKAKYDVEKPYFNSGVMVFRSKDIQENTFKGLRSLFRKYYPAIRFAEEGPLNLFFNGRWSKLPLIYNTYAGWIDFNPHAEAKLIHFPGKNKPWDKENPFHREWRSNLARAQDIDLNLPQKPVTWSENKIKLNSLKLKVKVFIRDIIYDVNRQLGLLGIFMRRLLR